MNKGGQVVLVEGAALNGSFIENQPGGLAGTSVDGTSQRYGVMVDHALPHRRRGRHRLDADVHAADGVGAGAGDSVGRIFDAFPEIIAS